MADLKDMDEKDRKRAIERLEKLNPLGLKRPMHSGNENTAAKYEDTILRRQASLQRQAGGAYSFDMDSTTGVSRVPILFVDPLFDPVLLLFPVNDLEQLNKRLRHYYMYHYLVGNIIDLHAEFPLSDHTLECEDDSVKKYFNDFKDRIGALEIMTQQLRGYHLLGESIHYGNWDNNNFEWESFTQFQPEDVELMDTFVSQPVFFLKIKKDSEIGKIVNNTTDLVTRAITELLPEKLVSAARTGRRIHLDSSRVLYFANKPEGSMKRGHSLLKRCLKDLVHEDRLRLLQQSFIERHSKPIKIFKVGSKELGWIPSDRHMVKLQKLLAQASNDPDFNLIYHPFLEVDYVGTKDKIANLAGEFEDVQKKIMVGLFANDALVHGDSTTYASSTVQLKIIMFKYLTQRAKLENMWKYKVFLPLAMKRGFIKRSKAEIEHKIRINGKLEKYMKVKGQNRVIEAEYVLDDAGKHIIGSDGKPFLRIGNSVYKGSEYDKYIIPEYIWQKRNLTDNSSERDLLKHMRDNDEIPFEMIADTMGWNMNHINDMFKKEQSTMFDKKYRDVINKKIEKDETYRGLILEGKTPKEALKETERLKQKEKEPVVTPEAVIQHELEPAVPKEEAKEIPSEEGEGKERLPVGGKEVIEE
jgi:hypothetical protein